MSYIDPLSQLPYTLDDALGVPTPTPAPMPPGPPPGPFGMNGGVADAIAQSLLGTLHGLGPINPRMGQGEQFAQAFLRSALGAVATPRVQAMSDRQDAAKRAKEANIRATEEYRKSISAAASDLRKHGLTLAEQRAKEAAKVPTVEKTPQQIRAEAAAREAGSLDARKAAGIDVTRNGNSGASETDATDIAGAIISGQQPPDLTGMYRYGAPVRAELARHGYDLTKASTDWKAVQRFLSSANGPQQIRLRQAVRTAYESLDKIDELNSTLARQVPRGSIPEVNAVTMATAKRGAFGPDAASTAQQLEAQISDLTSELGNAYMGGNSPTDHALQLAAKNLSGKWSQKVLRDMVQLARQNLQYRINAIENSGVLSPSNSLENTGGMNIGSRRIESSKGWFKANAPGGKK